jgi:signal transduction histidine kinase
VQIPVRYQNETLGELLVARRAPHENFSSADMQLLETVARQAGAVVYTARLNTQLQQSRERIISEREQERRRLRRELHDGLGPTLASQTLKLDAALELVQGEDAAHAGARRILQDVKTQTQNMIAEIRRIVYELRPPALDELGLVGALRAQLAPQNHAAGLEITLDAPAELPPLSAALQVNAYRIVLEAVNNAVKHAEATHCRVRIGANGELRLEIVDDGIGLAENVRAGVGLTSMRERAAELGGTLRIEPNSPRGTRVVAELPIGRGA